MLCYLSIVQSSGMGKSRVIDALSKTHLVVPINLQERLIGMLCGFSLVFIRQIS